MGKVFAAKGVCSRKLTFDEQQAQKPLWLQMQEASKAVMDAAIALGLDPKFELKLDHARGTDKEIALERAVRRFVGLTKVTGPVILIPVGK